MIEHLKSPKFTAYGFDNRIVETIEKLGFRTPTNIQVIQVFFTDQGIIYTGGTESFINDVTQS